LRTRLIVTFAAGASVALLLCLVGLFVIVDQRLHSELDTSVTVRGDDLAASITTQDERVVASDPLAQLYAPDGKLLVGSPALAGGRLLTVAQVRGTGRPWLTNVDLPLGPGTSPGPLRLQSRRLPGTGEVLTVGAAARVIDRASVGTLAVLAVAAPLLIAALVAAGWLVVRAALRPVDALTREAAAISTLDTERRLPKIAGNDEFSRLAATLDGMLERLRVAFARERAFVDDASHELRTPIAVLCGELELALTAIDDPAEVAESLRAAQAQALRLSRLSEDLLLLARERAGTLVADRHQIELRAWVAEETRPLAAAVGLRIETQGAPVEALIDVDRMRQVLTNLAGNSAAAGAGTARVTVGRDATGAWLAWADDGPGFPPELLGAVFDRFVRGNTARSAGSGAGLGLSIVRAIVAAHEGSVAASNGPPLGGAVVRVHLRGS
jgi:signal transduction histidine kinase